MCSRYCKRCSCTFPRYQSKIWHPEIVTPKFQIDIISDQVFAVVWSWYMVETTHFSQVRRKVRFFIKKHTKNYIPTSNHSFSELEWIVTKTSLHRKKVWMLKFPILQSEKCFRNCSSRNQRLKTTPRVTAGCALGTARCAAAHFRGSNRNVSTSSCTNQNFKHFA